MGINIDTTENKNINTNVNAGAGKDTLSGQFNPWPTAGEKFNYQSMNFFQRLWGHFKTISTHKMYVAKGCFRLGLYWKGIIHDLSKFSPTEFFTGVKYFDGHR